MNEEKMEVIIDGANIIHDDRGIVMKDESGERVMQTRPERLAAAILFCENKGWKATAVLKKMSYYIASKNKDGEYVGDMNLVDDLISKKKVMIISQKKDDIYFINLAIERNAYIITRDGFKEEREMYPGLDWEDIDNRTLKGHEFMGSDFILPGLPEHSAEIPMDISYAEFKLLSDKVEFLENKIQMIEDSQKIQSEATKDIVADFQPNEIVLSLLHSSLKGGTEITLNGFYEETLRAVLGHKRTKNSHTGKALRQKLGYSKSLGFLQWLVNLSNHKIQHRSNKGKVFIAKV